MDSALKDLGINVAIKFYPGVSLTHTFPCLISFEMCFSVEEAVQEPSARVGEGIPSRAQA